MKNKNSPFGWCQKGTVPNLIHDRDVNLYPIKSFRFILNIVLVLFVVSSVIAQNKILFAFSVSPLALLLILYNLRLLVLIVREFKNFFDEIKELKF